MKFRNFRVVKRYSVTGVTVEWVGEMVARIFIIIYIIYNIYNNKLIFESLWMGEVAKMAVTGVTVVTPESTFSVRTVNVFSTNNQPNQADIVCEKFCGSCGSLYLCRKLRKE